MLYMYYQEKRRRKFESFFSVNYYHLDGDIFHTVNSSYGEGKTFFSINQCLTVEFHLQVPFPCGKSHFHILLVDMATHRCSLESQMLPVAHNIMILISKQSKEPFTGDNRVFTHANEFNFNQPKSRKMLTVLYSSLFFLAASCNYCTIGRFSEGFFERQWVHWPVPSP